MQESLVESRVVLAQIVITGAGYCGKHYWTSTPSRQTAKGRATSSRTTLVGTGLCVP